MRSASNETILPLRPAGQAAKPNRFAQVGRGALDLDHAVELDIDVAAADRMDAAGIELARRGHHRREFRNIQNVETTHDTVSWLR